MFEWYTRVMLVCSNQALCKQVEDVLRKITMPYHLVYKGSDVGDALKEFTALQPDVVIAEMSIPGIDGIAMFKILNDEHLKCIRVLVGKPDQSYDFSVMQSIVRAHPDDYIVTSITDSELEQTLLRYQDRIGQRRERLITSFLNGRGANWEPSFLSSVLPYGFAPIMLCTNGLSDSDLQRICQRVNQIYPTLHLFVPALDRPSQFAVLVKCVSHANRTLRSPEERQADIYILSLATSTLGFTPYLLTVEPLSSAELNKAYNAISESVNYSIGIENGRPVRVSIPFQRPITDDELMDDELYALLNFDNMASFWERVVELPLCREDLNRQINRCILMLARKGFFGDSLDYPLLYRKIYDLIAKAERLTDVSQPLEQLMLQYRRTARKRVDDDTLFTEITNFLIANIGGNLSQEDIANAFSISKSKLAKLVQNKRGDSVMRYYTSLKIDRAKQLLQTTQLVSSIAHHLGFSDPLYFSRVFKQYTGESPNSYRTEMLTQEAKQRRGSEQSH